MSDEKRRGFVFYTQDYFGEIAVRLMPPALRLVWVEAFLLMDRSPQRGLLLKEDGTLYAAEELALVMNVPVPLVREALDYVVAKKIASIDRQTGAIINRKMWRDEARRRINSNNGRKGGNPALLFADPPPPFAAPAEAPAAVPEQPAADPPAKGRQPDPVYAAFIDAWAASVDGLPYRHTKGDWVQLAKMRQDYSLAATAAPPNCAAVVANYFASENSLKRTLAHLCANWPLYIAGPLDRYGRLAGTGSESKQQRARRVNSALARKIVAAEAPPMMERGRLKK